MALCVRSMWLFGAIAPALWLGGCGGYESAYERAVYDYESVYCYRTLGDPDCYRAADTRAERRLVNYYGPSPRRAEAPEATAIRLDPPPAISPERAAGVTGPSACPAGAEEGDCFGLARDGKSREPSGHGGPLDLGAPDRRVEEGRG